RRTVVPLVLVLVLVAGCGEDSKPCATWAECGRDEVCLPAVPDGDSFCGKIDDECPTGLRWSGSAGQGLAAQCVTFAPRSDAAVDASADARDARDAPADAVD